MSSDDLFISRDELFSGLPTRQASTLLFAIESRTAHLKQQSQLAATRFRVEKSAEEEEDSFFKALSEGRVFQPDVSIQDLERYALEWALLIPQDNTGIRAALAHLIGEKYIFTHQNIPSICDVLAFDKEFVKEAYQSHYTQSIENIYAPQISRQEQLKWAWSRLAQRLENLPPFWTAFSLTITETAGASILALPIAVSKIGVAGGLVLLLVLGLANILTLSALVEAITRNGNMRYGNTYFGSLVRDYLGNIGMFILSICLLSFIVLILIAYYIGISATLEEATDIPSTVWAVLIFVVGFYFLRGESLNATIASAMMISVINIGIILALVILALPHVDIQYLRYSNIPFIDGESFDPSIMEVIFGVILAAYFGHTSAGNAAKVVLRQDHGGRSLIWGNIMALLTVMVLYGLWVFAVNGSVAPDVLVNTQGTALSPLAKVLGPTALVLGSVFVILGMGMGSIHYSLALFNQIGEWLPAPKQSSQHQPESISLVKRILQSKNGQFWISIVPIIFILLLVEWLILTNQQSFTGLIGIMGVITVPLLGGIFPMLMLAASRYKGEYVPDIVFKWLGHRFVLISTYFLFLVSIFLHGLIIWEDPILRIIAILVTGVILWMTYIIVQGGAFTKYAIIELRINQSVQEWVFFNATAAGKPLSVDVQLDYGDEKQLMHTATAELPRFRQLELITIDLPEIPMQKLKLWAHQITFKDNSVSMPVFVELHGSEEVEEYNLKQLGGQVIVQIQENTPYQIKIHFHLADSE